ncbi:phosphotransacetylase family protein [Pelotomaculum propionicicum]|uniref:Phosphate acetyltransferase n=1 Tax=Pelotomaculum propionicicum TaxID=258475 RepID=A0A4Y7RNK1_9FIRM|nr:phosphotransacetylase family protein [Pelotomaculum propionicicum]TEB10330.1 Phosphate acetyltransferase [Pelotomaculum propionicicum]
MKNIYLTGVAGSGKTAVALGIALKLKKEGCKVAYFKPVGSRAKFNGGEDNDALLMKEVLSIKADIKKVVPFTLGASYLSGLKNQQQILDIINEAYGEIARGTDLVIIDGASFPHTGASYGIDAINLAGFFNASILNIIKLENDLSLDQAIFFNDHINARGLEVIGHIFNNVPRQLMSKTDGIFKPVLEKMGCKTVGVIPLRAEIASPTVSEYYEALGGELLTGEDGLGLLVEEVIVGAMTLESAFSYMRRSANKAVIMGGDRADLALATLETSTSALILTGGLYPDVKVISRAAEKGVPVILVHSDTYTTIEKISEVSRRIPPGDAEGINIAVENIERHCDWQSILKSIESDLSS